MYASGGHAYVYLCYGIHHLFNVVTGEKETPHAILIRALEPVQGVRWMLERTGKKKLDFSLTRGPGNLAKAMGLHTGHSGLSILRGQIFIADDGSLPPAVVDCARIGVAYAGEDAKLPYRFYVHGNPYVSKSS